MAEVYTYPHPAQDLGRGSGSRCPGSAFGAPHSGAYSAEAPFTLHLDTAAMACPPTPEPGWDSPASDSSGRRRKHGGGLRRIALEELRVGVDSPPDELLCLDETLRQLGKSDGETAELVKLHCFAGLSIEQAADILKISHRTAYRDWAYARAWLFNRIERVGQNPPDQDS